MGYNTFDRADLKRTADTVEVLPFIFRPGSPTDLSIRFIIPELILNRNRPEDTNPSR
jgi:hypothetical protein